eukprot:CAMPEP_0182898494 /NCGR_PEP_ID=MMETSP0034_2-20130328/27516_1 /TAXON_ID=156128 /ORGANISM="Nephroselmis pyriformis, Strain CCMP717" /LENGTH=222 /DNA_ID=CAMNT_0025032467 /DNA_START=40 /DNA_END=705 /DNA_ORIENTATION=+
MQPAGDSLGLRGDQQREILPLVARLHLPQVVPHARADQQRGPQLEERAQRHRSREHLLHLLEVRPNEADGVGVQQDRRVRKREGKGVAALWPQQLRKPHQAIRHNVGVKDEEERLREEQAPRPWQQALQACGLLPDVLEHLYVVLVLHPLHLRGERLLGKPPAFGPPPSSTSFHPFSSSKRLSDSTLAGSRASHSASYMLGGGTSPPAAARNLAPRALGGAR